MNLELINCVVVDDEDYPRNAIIETIHESPYFEYVGQAKEVNSAILEIQMKKPDLVFLDILLRGGNAFDVLEKLNTLNVPIPFLVVNSGLNNYDFATRFLNEYKESVLLILKKPFWENWEQKEKEIIEKYNSELDKRSVSKARKSLVIKSKHNSYLVSFDDILFCEVSDSKSQGKLVIHTKNRKYETFRTLNKMLTALPNNFIRVSRYTCINIDHFSHFNHSDQVLYLHNVKKSIGVGNAYKDELQRILNLA